MQYESICSRLQDQANMQKGLQDRVVALETRIDAKETSTKLNHDALVAELKLHKATVDDRMAALEHDLSRLKEASRAPSTTSQSAQDFTVFVGGFPAGTHRDIIQ
eukprot:5114622-Prorocentrum_lima.AAC.1